MATPFGPETRQKEHQMVTKLPWFGASSMTLSLLIAASFGWQSCRLPQFEWLLLTRPHHTEFQGRSG